MKRGSFIKSAIAILVSPIAFLPKAKQEKVVFFRQSVHEIGISCGNAVLLKKDVGASEYEKVKRMINREPPPGECLDLDGKKAFASIDLTKDFSNLSDKSKKIILNVIDHFKNKS